MRADDPRLPQIGRINREINSETGGYFFYGWDVVRRYSSEEIDSAGLFRLIVTRSAYFEPAGEDCGTLYDDGPACDVCLAGAKQVGPLYLDISRIPKSKDIAKTIGGEIVVSQRLVDIFTEHVVTGAAFRPVRQRKMKNLRPNGWYQLAVRPPEAEIVPPTRVGLDPFDDDPEGKYRCPQGDTIGLNLLSEVTIGVGSQYKADVIATRQFVGRRAGVLRPEKVILVSPRVRRLFENSRLKGCRFEIAHVEPIMKTD